MTVSITVLGIVQGVGFRPFVARTAEELGIAGTVRNSGGIVKIIAAGEREAVDELVHRLRFQSPKGAQVTEVLCAPVECAEKPPGFRIVESDEDRNPLPMLPPDLPVCKDCLHEMRDPKNRRYGYPFISCVACGPRYSIVKRLPYDRNTTTMEDFPMCGACEAEYTGKGRRRHAQTISCHDCGPQLIFEEKGCILQRQKALERAAELLQSGAVLAVKGIGGYQFICLPYCETTVEQLRLLKKRDKKPFAVMFPSLRAAGELCIVGKEETELLTSPARPIVLLAKKKDIFAPNVAGESRRIGAFLPYTPLHQMLTDICGPLVVTSGNVSSEPIITEDREMLDAVLPNLSGILYNTRRIETPLDDSVARVAAGTKQLLRRSRGYVPLPVRIKKKTRRPFLAMGGDLKACFALCMENQVYLSQHFGDVEEYKVLREFRRGIQRMEEIFGIRPKAVLHDLHPAYQTFALAQEMNEKQAVPLRGIQHHHAHAASVMAEHGIEHCIGVVFDGTGYGPNGTIWGGEFLRCRGTEFERIGQLEEIVLCGGDASARDAELTGLCHKYAAGLSDGSSRFAVAAAAIKQRVNTERSSSMGRLFDAVSALLGLRQYNSYEGECAVSVENAAADAQEKGDTPFPLCFDIVEREGRFKALRTPVIRAIADAAGREDAGRLALGFHAALADMVVRMCRMIREKTGENNVALTGGVFANLLLTERCADLLKNEGFHVWLNSAVPCNDGGLALGQAYLGAQWF